MDMTNQITPHELVKFDLFDGLSEVELTSLVPYFVTLHMRTGQIVTLEGQKPDLLYLIADGTLEVIKKDPETGQNHIIATLTKYNSIGEMALLDEKPRSASVRAIGPATLYAITIDDIKKFAAVHLQAYMLVLKNIGKETSQRLRYTNEVTISSLTRQMRMGNFLITAIIVLCSYAFFLKFMPEFVKKSRTDVNASLIILISVVFPILYFIKFKDYSIGQNWFNISNWKRNIIEAILYTLPILALIVAVKAFAMKEFSHLPYHALFDGPFVMNDFSPKILTFFSIYLLGCLIQEFIVRGILQESLQIFLSGRAVVLRSIFVSNIFYSTIHFYLPLSYTIAALIFGFYLGWLYSRQKTLLGVTVAHAIIGVWTIYIVGVSSIFYA